MSKTATENETFEALLVLATKPFRKLTEREYYGFAGASEDAVIFEDEDNGFVWIFDPKNDTGELEPRLERFDENGNAIYWNLQQISSGRNF